MLDAQCTDAGLNALDGAGLEGRCTDSASDRRQGQRPRGKRRHRIGGPEIEVECSDDRCATWTAAIATNTTTSAAETITARSGWRRK
jgi:hypothetical protein